MFAHPSLEQDFACREAILAGDLSQPATLKALASLVDQTLLKADCAQNQIDVLCQEATQYEFRSVCVAPCRVALAVTSLAAAARAFVQTNKSASPVLVCTVVGFPLGANTTQMKCAETTLAVQQGAHEIDFVQNLGWVKDGRFDALEAEAKAIVEAAQGALVKVILETSALTPEEIIFSLHAAARAGVAVIKTSTGMGSRGASIEDLTLISKQLAQHERDTGMRLGIKASGGVRTQADAIAFVRAGATRLGTSGGISLLLANTPPTPITPHNQTY